ncbi:LysR family transcriptional regulator [Lacticaseibacillus hulanensis]|uniref:LysR family transcriptional regulator n=1 Tax=Lacticaseibacillus hulanensis TaxID=2493111 RepID=UPI0013E2B299|nr:LysR family transcriptional regulator [Lacticaseibacillus hulanensis]
MFKNLTTFKTVYETRSFSRAATLLFIAQPTVSAQIKQLEAEFGLELFIRNGRGEVGITPAAKELYQETLTMLGTWAKLHQSLPGATGKQAICRIASSHTFATYLLPDLLPLLVDQFPAVQFSVQMANSQSVQDALLRRDADLGFIEKPLATKQLHRHTLINDQLVHAGTTGPWLIRENASGVYYYTNRFLTEKGITNDVIEIDNNAVIVNLLRSGFGQSIISARAAAGIQHVSLGPKFVRQFYLVNRQDDGNNPVAQVCRAVRVFYAQQDGAPAAN